MAEEEEAIPRLIQERPLTVQDSLLCVLFPSQNQSENLIMTTSEIKDRLDTFFPEKKDQTKVYRRLDESLSRLRDLSFIREIESTNTFDRTFEIRRIIKSKINIEETYFSEYPPA